MEKDKIEIEKLKSSISEKDLKITELKTYKDKHEEEKKEIGKLKSSISEKDKIISEFYTKYTQFDKK